MMTILALLCFAYAIKVAFDMDRPFGLRLIQSMLLFTGGFVCVATITA